jgi:hypothetical protein
MADEDKGQPTTFGADRWRFARAKTAQRLLPAFRSFFSSATALTIAFILGSLLFGAAYVLDEAEAYVAELLAIAALPALALLAWPSVLLFYWLRAPAAMWRRDQEIIAQWQGFPYPCTAPYVRRSMPAIRAPRQSYFIRQREQIS